MLEQMEDNKAPIRMEWQHEILWTKYVDGCGWKLMFFSGQGLLRPALYETGGRRGRREYLIFEPLS